TEYKDKIYLGINLNSHFINYEKFTNFFETNDNGGEVSDLRFGNRLTTLGSGFSFQLGGIAKVTEEFRVGVSYNSPTWFRITDELVQSINSNYADPEIDYISTIVNIFPDYKLQTPGKLTGSLAYVFGDEGLISLDRKSVV